MLKIPSLVALGFGEQPTPYRRPPAVVEIIPMVPSRVRSVAVMDRMGLDPAWDEATFHRALAEHGRYGIVATSGPHARAVGYAVVDAGADVATVLRFGADESLRRRGVMTAIFRRIADDAAQDGRAGVEVPVPETLAEPRRFLQAIGFRGRGVCRGFYGDRDAYLMTKAVERHECMGKWREGGDGR